MGKMSVLAGFRGLRLLPAVALAALLLACGNGEFKVTSLTIYPTELETEVGDTSQISFALVYEGGDFDDPDLISPQWSSSNDTVAKVDTMGSVASLALGEARITMTIGGVEGYCDVTVVDAVADDDEGEDDYGDVTDDDDDDDEVLLL